MITNSGAWYIYVIGSYFETNELLKQGLTPRIFWKYRTELIASPRAKLEELIKHILSLSQIECSASSTTANLSEFVLSPSPIHRVNSQIQLASFSPPDLNTLLSSLQSEIKAGVAYVVLEFSRSPTCSGSCIMGPTQNILHIFSPSKSKAKPDAYFLQYVLPTAIPFIKANLFRGAPKTIYILEGCGNHPEILLDMSVGLAVVAIQLFFDKMGILTPIDEAQGQIFIDLSKDDSMCSDVTCFLVADKQTIRTRLEWIIESVPRANPSRATLKRVNEFLLTPSLYLHPKNR